MTFIHDNFLLHSKAAQRLYHDYAASQPILDYHSHLTAADIESNRRFTDLFEIWLEGDHYKWRAMRADGVAERFVTGDATPYEKFSAWARTVPNTLRNPLYHWTHLELKRYFDIDDLLNEQTAPRIWERAAELLRSDDLAAHGILNKFGVQAVCTSDDPADSLARHDTINSRDLGFRVYPSFRPDRSLLVDQPHALNQWVNQLESSCNTAISNLSGLMSALDSSHQRFHDSGCRLSDHGLPHCYADACSESRAAEIFSRARAGQAASAEQHRQFASFMMVFLGHLDAKRDWTKQLHLGPIRNANTRLLRELGPDTGFDSIGDFPQAAALNAYLNNLDAEHALPRTIIYNSNPADNYAFATAIGNFQDGAFAGKVQFGSGWWFLDQKEGIEMHLNALSNCGLLSRFVGMVTDSRSFMSFPRHEYFRRVLCNLLGNEMENGELPNDEKLVGNMVRNICFDNARDYLGLDLTSSHTSDKPAAIARS